MADSPQVLVAGAGPTGLGAAWELSRRGVPSLVVEKAPGIGGMAATLHRDGLLLKAGVHLLHPSTDALRPLVAELTGLMGAEARHVVPTSAIHFLGRFLDYPFRTGQVVAALGPSRLAQVATGAALARARALGRRVTGRGVHDHAARLVHDEQPIVLVDDGERNLLRLGPERRGRGEVDGDEVARVGPVGRPGPFPAQGDPALVEQAPRVGAGQAAEDLAEKDVDADASARSREGAQARRFQGQPFPPSDAPSFLRAGHRHVGRSFANRTTIPRAIDEQTISVSARLNVGKT